MEGLTYDMLSIWITQAGLNDSDRWTDMKIICYSQRLYGIEGCIASYNKIEAFQCDLLPIIPRSQRGSRAAHSEHHSLDPA